MFSVAISRLLAYTSARVLGGPGRVSRWGGRGGGGIPDASVVAVALLAGLHAHLQPVLRGRKRARRVGREGTRRVVGPVEIQHHLPVLGQVRVQEAARAVRVRPVRLVPEDEEELGGAG